MEEIWIELKNGSTECVDTADSESEAIQLVEEYRMAYGDSVRRIWIQLPNY